MRIRMPLPKLDSTGQFFEQWWSTQGEWVEQPNQRRGGESGVLRTTTEDGKVIYIKRQENHIYRDIFHPFGQATIIREYKAYCALTKAQVNVPKLIYCGVQNKKAILVTEALDGFIDLDSWMEQNQGQPFYAETLNKILTETATMLAKLHLNKLQHGSLYGKHLFVKAETNEQPLVEVALLDLEKIKKRNTAKEAALHDIPKIKRHSLLNSEQWHFFVNAYEQAFGSKLPKLHQ
ncbi:InaA protein [Entomomonas moraniae]|uniref:InaA protein n=2 Tax=Entomomonas moraniae TaxID=2213226 RepID=A0A3S9XEN9_9GAMM|nr:InaA protein [Entomomonas moraniae]